MQNYEKIVEDSIYPTREEVKEYRNIYGTSVTFTLEKLTEEKTVKFLGNLLERLERIENNNSSYHNNSNCDFLMRQVFPEKIIKLLKGNINEK